MRSLMLCFAGGLLALLLAAGAMAAEPDASSGLAQSGAVGAEPSLPEAPLPFTEEEEALVVWDPIEPVNRGIFWVNDKLYVFLFKPVARGLRLIPEPIRITVGNVFDNLKTPVHMVNSLLQLKPAAAGTDLARFGFNTVFGICGLFDPATELGLKSSQEDLGQTFGRYGAGPGFYLVLPILGPSNLRDGIGRVGDYFIDPLTLLLPSDEALAARAVQYENVISLDKDTYEGIKKDSLDPYLFIRDAYAQRRQGQIEK